MTAASLVAAVECLLGRVRAGEVPEREVPSALEALLVEHRAAAGSAATVVVSTDGACSGNPGPAGWAWVRHNDGCYRRGGLGRSTNQAAELTALVDVLREHAEVPDLMVRTDSSYVIGTYASWMDAARRRGWVNSQGRPTSNRALLEQLIAARDARRDAGLPPVRLVKVKGHSGDAGNSTADRLAVQAKGEPAGAVVAGVLGPEEAAVLLAAGGGAADGPHTRRTWSES